MAIATGTAILTAAAAAAATGIYSSHRASKAARQAASIQAGSQNQATAMQMEYLWQTREDIAEAVDAGLIDLDTGFNMAIEQFEPLTGLEEYNTARQLLRDPSAIMDRPSTQFQYGQGIDALQSAFSRTSGGGVSGPAMKGAVEYGQNFASMALDAELNRLFPFINTAIGARSNMANLYQGLGTSKANLRVGGVTQTAGIVGQQMPSITQGIANQGNIAASGMINQANIRTGLYSNLAGMGTNMAMLYATNPGLFSSGGGSQLFPGSQNLIPNSAAQQGTPNIMTIR
jgi:hypothetical protein